MVTNFYAALYLLLLTSTSHALLPPFNTSVLRLPSTPPASFPVTLNRHPLIDPNVKSSISSDLQEIVQDIVEAVSAKERWDPRAEVRVLGVDAAGARIGASQRYEFKVRVGKTVLLLRFPEEVVSWRKLERGEWIASDLTAGGDAGGQRSAVDGFELDGPFELRVGGGDDELSLQLAATNITHGGLRRVHVGNGITIKVEGAREVSLVHLNGISLSVNESIHTKKHHLNQFWSSGFSSCTPLLSVNVVGPVSLTAYWTHNSEAKIETTFLSHDSVELLTDKCYMKGRLTQIPPYSSQPLLSRSTFFVEELMSNSLAQKLLQNRTARLLKAKITSSTLVKFRIVLERDITENDRIWKKVAKWRTRPVVKRHSFEVLARVKPGKGLRAAMVKESKRPFVVEDSTAWSNLMSNISFTEFPSVVVPPEALTLDVKW